MYAIRALSHRADLYRCRHLLPVSGLRLRHASTHRLHLPSRIVPPHRQARANITSRQGFAYGSRSSSK